MQFSSEKLSGLGELSSDLSLLGDYIIEQPGSPDRSTLNLTII